MIQISRTLSLVASLKTSRQITSCLVSKPVCCETLGSWDSLYSVTCADHRYSSTKIKHKRRLLSMTCRYGRQQTRAITTLQIQKLAAESNHFIDDSAPNQNWLSATSLSLKLLVVVDVDASPVEEGEKVSKEQEVEGEDLGKKGKRDRFSPCCRLLTLRW